MITYIVAIRGADSYSYNTSKTLEEKRLQLEPYDGKKLCLR